MPKKHTIRSIYVIRAEGGLVKIGVAAQVGVRLRVLRGSSPAALSLEYAAECPNDVAADKIEAHIHALFRAHRSSGEWFSISVEDAKEAIAATAAKLGYNIYPYSIGNDGPGIHLRLTESPINRALRLLLRDYRAALRLNQTELALRLGWSRQCITKIEVGEKRVTISEWIELGKALNFDPVQALRTVIENASPPVALPKRDQTQALPPAQSTPPQIRASILSRSG